MIFLPRFMLPQHRHHLKTFLRKHKQSLKHQDGLEGKILSVAPLRSFKEQTFMSLAAKGPWFFLQLPKLSWVPGKLLVNQERNLPKSWRSSMSSIHFHCLMWHLHSHVGLWKFNQVHSQWPLTNSSQLRTYDMIYLGVDWRLYCVPLPKNQQHLLKFWLSGPINITLFENRIWIFEDVIKLRWGY